MSDITTLSILFFFVSILYSMAGFGGGSSYIGLLLLFPAPVQLVPVIGLICNLTVTLQGSIIFSKAGHIKWKLLMPLIITSVPAAYIGGSIRIEDNTLIIILASCLLVAGILLLLGKSNHQEPVPNISKRSRKIASLILGFFLGGTAGISGIGGGIYLAPILNLLKWAKPKEIASIASVFILINSMAGLLGQVIKRDFLWSDFQSYLILPAVVLVGGFIGSNLAAYKIPQQGVRILTAILVIGVAIKLWFQILKA